MYIHGCGIFVSDGASYSKTKQVQEYLKKVKITMLERDSNSPDLNPIKNLWGYMKNKIADKQLANAFVDTIKNVCTTEISAEYYQSSNL